MTEAERNQLIRRYAAGEITWHELRERGFSDYVEVLGSLGEAGLRPPVAGMEGAGVVGPLSKRRCAGTDE